MSSRMQTFSLRARLTLLLALAVLVVFGAAAKVVDWRADAEMQQRFDASLLARAQSLAALTQIENGRIAVDADNVAAAVFPGNAESSWYDLRCGGAVVARSADAPPQLAIDTPCGCVRLVVRDPREARQRPRREGEVRLDAAALARLLEQTGGEE